MGSAGYRGRLAPTPSGYLHEGHVQTFRVVQERAVSQGGTVILRNDNLDRNRCRPEYEQAMMEDLRALGFRWQEGPDCGGPVGPYAQAERQTSYQEFWEKLVAARVVYPCFCSRKDVREALAAPQEGGGEGEMVFPPDLRPSGEWEMPEEPLFCNWRFRVPDGQAITFADGRVGACRYEAGKDFGDFLVWRKDGYPSYELATVIDDHLMNITEVVRGEDLLLSTARQLLLYEALGWAPPQFYHTPLLRDQTGRRLAKRDHAARAAKPSREK